GAGLRRPLGPATPRRHPAPPLGLGQAGAGRDLPRGRPRPLVRAAPRPRILGPRNPARLVQRPVHPDLKEFPMLRRDFLMLTAAVSLAPWAAKADFIPYAPGVAEEAMARGERIILDFHATWCSTCARQQRVMEQL